LLEIQNFPLEFRRKFAVSVGELQLSAPPNFLFMTPLLEVFTANLGHRSLHIWVLCTVNNITAV